MMLEGYKERVRAMAQSEDARHRLPLSDLPAAQWALSVLRVEDEALAGIRGAVVDSLALWLKASDELEAAARARGGSGTIPAETRDGIKECLADGQALATRLHALVDDALTNGDIEKAKDVSRFRLSLLLQALKLDQAIGSTCPRAARRGAAGEAVAAPPAFAGAAGTAGTSVDRAAPAGAPRVDDGFGLGQRKDILLFAVMLGCALFLFARLFHGFAVDASVRKSAPVEVELAAAYQLESATIVNREFEGIVGPQWTGLSAAETKQKIERLRSAVQWKGARGGFLAGPRGETIAVWWDDGLSVRGGRNTWLMPATGLP